MILHFDITTTATLFASARSPIPPNEGNASSCPVGAYMGRPFAGLAFSRQKRASQTTARVFCAGKVQPRQRLGRLHAKNVENLSACLFDDRKKPTCVPLSKRDGNISKVAVITNTIMYNMSHLFRGLKVAEVAGLAHNLCGSYESYATELNADIRLRNVMADLKDLSDRILDSLRNNRLINSLEVQDTHRNRCVSALVNLKKGYDKLSDETVQSHWTVLRPVFENFLSSIQEGNYQSKTALITAMLRRLSDSDLVSHLEGLADLKTAVDRLRDAQQSFDSAQLEYQLQLQKDKTLSATDLKDEIVEYINQKLVVHLEAKCNEDLATYAAFARLVDAQIRAENAKVRRRKGKKETPSEIPAKE